MNKKISVLIPVRNGGCFLENSIKSIISQTYENIEVLIMDNGSSDMSWQIIMDYKKLDSRIKAIRNKNTGFTKSLNLMIELASGEFIARLDSDDISFADRLEKQYKILESNQNALLTTHKCKIVDEKGNEIYQSGPSEDSEKIKWSLIFKNEIWHSSTMWRNYKGIKYNEYFKYSQDYDLWSRISRKHTIKSTYEVLGIITKRKKSITVEKQKEQDLFSILVSKSNMENYLGEKISFEQVEMIRKAEEGKDVDKEIKELHNKIKEKFKNVKEKEKIKIKIGKKQNDFKDIEKLNKINMDSKIKISQNRWIHSKKKIENGKKYIWAKRELKYIEVEICDYEISPLYGASTEENPWEGSSTKKPWEYKATAVIPCLNTPETLPLCIELLRLQTEKPFIIIIDTGSIDDYLRSVEQLRSEDVEVHTIRMNGVRHPSDYPAMAMDMAFSLCRTEYLFATHSDCFVRNRNLIKEFIDLCQTKSPVVGYELSPRAHKDWVGMVSHTASMYHMPTMDNIGFGWSLRRLCNRYQIVDYKPNPSKPNWPDTEILGNYILKENGIIPHLVGKEGNQCRTLDQNIDHFRSYGAAKMYSPDYYPKVLDWYHSAKKEALKRIEEWSR